MQFNLQNLFIFFEINEEKNQGVFNLLYCFQKGCKVNLSIIKEFLKQMNERKVWKQ